MLGKWEEAAPDMHDASNIDYDDEINVVLKKGRVLLEKSLCILHKTTCSCDPVEFRDKSYCGLVLFSPLLCFSFQES